jgi:acyl-CoA dehydrogenase
MLALGEIFTMVLMLSLILENAKIHKLPGEIIDEIFNFIVRDASTYSLNLLMNYNNSETQEALLRKMILKPVNDSAQQQGLDRSCTAAGRHL